MASENRMSTPLQRMLVEPPPAYGDDLYREAITMARNSGWGAVLRVIADAMAATRQHGSREARNDARRRILALLLMAECEDHG